MKIKKFNESNSAIDYFYDLIDSGWEVRYNEDTLMLYLFSREISKWFSNSISESHNPLINWGLASIKMETMRLCFEERRDQVKSIGLIINCLDHFCKSEGLEIVNLRYGKLGSESGNIRPMYPVDTLIITLK